MKTSPTYARLQELGAVFGEKSGWERANWFATNDGPAHGDRRPFGWAGQVWSTAIVTEHLACRERVALFDESSFAKIEVSGPDAAAFLGRLCANDVDRADGAVTYTQLLNEHGGIACDLTVTRLAEDRFLLVTGTAFGTHDRAWLERHRADEDVIEIRDVTSAWTCFGLWGPKARDVLSSVTADDVSDAAFPYLTMRGITVGDAPVMALRVTYVGELGWELYAPTEFGAGLFDLLLRAGEPFGMVPAGYRAIDTLRLEKGYLAWGSDITPEDSPLEAGLGFAVRLDGDRDFLGRSAVERMRAGGATRRLVTLVLDDPRAMVLGVEPVFRGAEVVARVTSGGLGYAVDTSIAFAYLPLAMAEPGTELAVRVFDRLVPATVVSGPLWILRTSASAAEGPVVAHSDLRRRSTDVARGECGEEDSDQRHEHDRHRDEPCLPHEGGSFLLTLHGNDPGAGRGRSSVTARGGGTSSGRSGAAGCRSSLR